MKGLRIFTHSVRMVLGNLGPALQVSGLLYLAQIGTAIVLNLPIFGNNDKFQQQIATGAIPMSSILIYLAVVLVSGLWIAVGWHRYVLLVEKPGSILPQIHGDRMWAYLGYTILVVLCLMPVAVITLLLVRLLAPLLVATVGVGFGTDLLIGALIFLPVMIVVYRVSVALPASALDERLGIGGAWRATKGASLDLTVLAIASGVILTLIDLPATQILTPNSLLASAWLAVSGWAYLMIGISILTTLYGHYVEKRALT